MLVFTVSSATVSLSRKTQLCCLINNKRRVGERTAAIEADRKRRYGLNGVVFRRLYVLGKFLMEAVCASFRSILCAVLWRLRFAKCC